MCLRQAGEEEEEPEEKDAGSALLRYRGLLLFPFPSSWTAGVVPGKAAAPRRVAAPLPEYGVAAGATTEAAAAADAEEARERADAEDRARAEAVREAESYESTFDRSRRVRGAILMSDEDSDRNITQWRLRRLLNSMDDVKAAGSTSCLTLLVRAKDDLATICALLTAEIHTAGGIRSNSNRNQVLAALTAGLQRVKCYAQTPRNGLILFSGVVQTEDGKDDLLCMDIEPFTPLNARIYLTGNRFFTEEIKPLLWVDDRYGFVIVSSHGALFGVVQGNSREVLHKHAARLPKKHGQGSQTLARFGRTRCEKMGGYLRKVGEFSRNFFLTNEKPNVAGLVVGSTSECFSDLTHGDIFGPQLQGVRIKPMVEVAYFGENGFYQAINAAAPLLKQVKLVREKHLISYLLDEIAEDTGKYCLGIEESMEALQLGAAEALLVWEGLDTYRLVLRNQLTEDESTLYVPEADARGAGRFRDKDTGAPLDLMEGDLFVDWIARKYKRFGTRLELVSDHSHEGKLLAKGFDGVAGILRYAVDFDR